MPWLIMGTGRRTCDHFVISAPPGSRPYIGSSSLLFPVFVSSPRRRTPPLLSPPIVLSRCSFTPVAVQRQITILMLSIPFRCSKSIIPSHFVEPSLLRCKPIPQNQARRPKVVETSAFQCQSLILFRRDTDNPSTHPGPGIKLQHENASPLSGGTGGCSAGQRRCPAARPSGRRAGRSGFRSARQCTWRPTWPP